MNPIYSILLIACGSMAAASYYVPIRKIRKWSWESYWIVQGIASWLIAPIVFSLLTVPNLGEVFRNTPPVAKFWTIFFGAMWGFGGLTFGLSMRYLGIALGQSIALGFCAAFGTLLPPIVAGRDLFASTEGILMVVGVAVALAGITVVGYAGSLKGKHMSAEDKIKSVKEFALKKGISIAVFSGIMSAAFNYGINGIEGVIDAGNVFQDVARELGTNPLFATNPALVFALIGGFITNFGYCVFLNIKNKTGKDYFSVPSDIFLSNLFFAFLGGTLWFVQFFFFGMGQSKLPEDMFAFGWSILMALNIAFSNIWGIILKEWKGASTKTIVFLIIGIVILILSTFVIKLG